MKRKYCILCGNTIKINELRKHLITHNPAAKNFTPEEVFALFEGEAIPFIVSRIFRTKVIAESEVEAIEEAYKKIDEIERQNIDPYVVGVSEMVATPYSAPENTFSETIHEVNASLQALDFKLEKQESTPSKREVCLIYNKKTTEGVVELKVCFKHKFI